MSEPEQKWMLLTCSDYISSENSYVGHSSKKNNDNIHTGAVTDSCSLSSNIVFIHAYTSIIPQITAIADFEQLQKVRINVGL